MAAYGVFSFHHNNQEHIMRTRTDIVTIDELRTLWFAHVAGVPWKLHLAFDSDGYCRHWFK